VPNGTMIICQVRVKPLSSKVEIDLNMDTHSENYDQDVSASLRLTKQVSFLIFHLS
jgi:hypothetical protein